MNLSPGEYFCFDYSFWNTPSIRGFTSILSAICLVTRYTFTFPTRHKRPPLSTISWFIRTLRRQGYKALYIQTDEGGKLGQSSDFLHLLSELECIYLGTGRSGSSLNGIIERPNRTLANSVRAKLLNAGLPDKFWCFAAEDANFKLRRMLHTAINKTPYQAWTGKIPEFSDMKIWGSQVYVVDTDVTRTKLANRTYVGLFMKFSSSTKIIVYYNPQTNKFGRTSHAYFDEMHVGIHEHPPTQNSVPGKKLISSFPRVTDDIHFSDIRSNLSTLPILQKPAVTYDIIMPPVGYICPITIYDDHKYGLPYIKSIPKSTPIGQQLPEQALKQQWILSIGTEEPIHAASALDEITRLRTSHANKKIQITLAPRVIDQANDYEQERTKFDQMRPILASASSLPSSNNINLSSSQISSAIHVDPPPHTTYNDDNPLSSDHHQSHENNTYDLAGATVPTISVFVHSPTKPSTPTTVHDCFHHPLKPFWIQTIFKQYDKNASYRVFTRPLLITSLHSNTLILKSVLAPTVKPTDIPSLWKLNI